MQITPATIDVGMASSSQSTENQLFTQEEFRAYIKIRSLLGISAAQIHRELVSIPGCVPPAERTVADWAARFKAGRQSVQDDPRSDRPTTVVTSEMITLLEDIVIEDPHSSVADIASQCGISVGSAHQILVENLRMRKICERWVPHTLSSAQKAERVELSQSLLNKMHRWGTNGLKRLVTGDETYLFYHNPGSRTQRMGWRKKGGPPLTSVRPSHFTEKTLYTIFFSCEGLVAKVIADPGQTVTGNYYRHAVLPQLLSEFHKLHPNTNPRIHHDNAPAHRSQLVLDFLSDHNVELVPHPPYSPDLAPCDFWLFPKLKAAIALKDYESRIALGQDLGRLLKTITLAEWSHAFATWRTRLQKCVEVEGEYFEHLL